MTLKIDRHLRGSRVILTLGLLLAVTQIYLMGCRSSAQTKVELSTLSSEQLQVYGDFLDEFSALHFKRLANRTAPLTSDDLPEGSACIRGLSLENQSRGGKALHQFDSEISKGRDINLVDPIAQAKTLQQMDEERSAQNAQSTGKSGKSTDIIASEYGFLALSEIVFDKNHQFAVLKYMYFCGARCKQGSTLVMEKVGTSWTAKTRRPCTMIIN